MEWELSPTQISDDKFLTALHHHGIVTTDEHGVVFRCPNHVFCRMNKDISFADLKEKAERKIRPEGAWRKDVERIRYRTINCRDDGTIRYGVMEIRSDEDVRSMMQAHANVPIGRQILELYIDVVNTTEEIMHLLRPPPSQPAASRKPVITHNCTLYCQGRYYYNEYGVYFDGPNTIYSRLKNNINFDQLHQILKEQAEVEGQEQDITEIGYRCPTIRDGHPIRWSVYTIKTDDDVEYMFLKHKRSEP